MKHENKLQTAPTLTTPCLLVSTVVFNSHWFQLVQLDLSWSHKWAIHVTCLKKSYLLWHEQAAQCLFSFVICQQYLACVYNSPLTSISSVRRDDSSHCPLHTTQLWACCRNPLLRSLQHMTRHLYLVLTQTPCHLKLAAALHKHCHDSDTVWFL